MNINNRLREIEKATELLRLEAENLVLGKLQEYSDTHGVEIHTNTVSFGHCILRTRKNSYPGWWYSNINDSYEDYTPLPHRLDQSMRIYESTFRISIGSAILKPTESIS